MYSVEENLFFDFDGLFFLVRVVLGFKFCCVDV